MMRALLELIGVRPTPQTAAEWVARTQSRRLTRGEARRLKDWLAVEDNSREFERIRGIDRWAARLRADPHLASNVAATARLTDIARISVKPRRAAATLFGLNIVTAAAACSVVGLSLLILLPRISSVSPTDWVATGRGQQRTIALADGSRVIVNTDSSLQVSYSADERRILLPRGEAFFDVTKDPAGRAFVVKAGDTEVRVLGTKFSVRTIDGRTDVIVSEGKVEVVPDAVQSITAAPAKVELIPGNALRIDRKENQVRIAAVDPERATAWRTGIVFFDDSSLVDVVDELNRYNAKPLVIANSRIQGTRMTGAFRIGDVEGVRFALKNAFGIDTVDEADRILLK